MQILREHLENQVAVGKLCEQYNINPNLFYLWKKELFGRAIEIFSKKKNGNVDEAKLSRLEEKLKDKDSLISEIVEDNLRLKKKLTGEYYKRAEKTGTKKSYISRIEAGKSDIQISTFYRIIELGLRKRLTISIT